MVKKKSNHSNGGGGGNNQQNGQANGAAAGGAGGGNKANGVSNGHAAAATSNGGGAPKQNGVVSNGTAGSSTTNHAAPRANGLPNGSAAGGAHQPAAATSTSSSSHKANGHAKASAASEKTTGTKQNGFLNGLANGVGKGGGGGSTASSKKSKSERASTERKGAVAATGGGGGRKAETSSSSSSSSSSSTQSSGGSSGDQSERSDYHIRSMRDHECQVEMGGQEDLVERFARLREWRKMETLGELVALLTPVQRQIMDAMLRGSTAHSAASLESYQRRVNNPRSLEAVQLKESLASQRELFLPSLSLLTPCNRLSACVLRSQLHKFVSDIPPVVIGHNEDEVVARIEEVLSMVVTALHHPAFSVDSQIELIRMREYLKNQLNDLLPHLQGQSKERPATTIKYMCCLEFKEKEEPPAAILELSWTDGQTTYASRTMRELNDMHRRLLDFFGMEKTNDERRALPYFPRQENFLAVHAYIDQLSNLPARMLLDDKFADEFGDTRALSDKLASSPVQHSVVSRRGRSDPPPELPYMNDLSLGILPQVEVPPLPPPADPRDCASCPYCAGTHVFESCPQLAVKGALVGEARIRSMGGPEWERIRCNCCN